MTATAAVKEHGIPFCGEMVHALQKRRKTRTRRLSERWMRVKAGDKLWVREAWASNSKHIVAYSAGAECGAWIDNGAGDREWMHHGFIIESPDYHAAASKSVAGACRTFGLAKYGGVPRGDYPFRYGWRTSMFMPRWASRITLIATADARREPLQAITEDEAEREGIERHYSGGCIGSIVTYKNYAPLPERACDRYTNPLNSFRSLWSSLHTKLGERWEDNPDVTVLSFEVAQ